MAIKSYKVLAEAARQTTGYWVEEAKHDFVFSLDRQLKRRKISNVALAQILGVSPPYVSKLMRGDENITIETMVKLARAVQGELHIEVREVSDGVHWYRRCRDYKVPAANVEVWRGALHSPVLAEAIA